MTLLGAKIRFSELVANSFLILTWMILGLVGYWAFIDDGQPYVSKFQSVSTTEAQRIGQVELTFQSDFLRACRIHNQRFLVANDGVRYAIGSYDYTIYRKFVGKSLPYIVTFTVPANLPSGTYQFLSVVTYSCNPVERLFPLTNEVNVQIDLHVK